MTPDTEHTAIVFRVWRGKWPTVIALMPYVDHDDAGQYCVSYEHIGQHGGADYAGCIRGTRPATATEYAPLLRELTQIGYRVRAIRRRGKGSSR